MRTVEAAQPSVKSAVAPSRKRPHDLEFWLLYIMLLVTVVSPLISKYQSSDDSTGSPLSQAIWSAMYLAAGVRLIAMRDWVRPLFTRVASLWIFLGLMFVSVVWSVAPTTTFTNAIELIGTTVIAAYIVARFTLQQFLFILALTFGTIAILCFGFIFFAPGHGRMDYGSGAWSGLYQDKNNLGASMSLAIISLVILLLETTWRNRILVFGALVLCGALLVGSNSATAFGDCVVTIAVVFAGLACRSTKFGILGRFVTIAIGLVAGCGVLVFGFTPDSIFSMLGRSTSLTGRTDFWPYLQQAIADRPLFGYGYNAFFRSHEGSNYLSYYVIEAGGWSPYHAHNSFLQICLDVGFVGAAIFAYVLMIAFWRGAVFFARSSSRLTAWPLAMLIYLVLGSFTETYFGNFNTFEWIFFVAALLYPLRDELPRLPFGANALRIVRDR